MVIKNVIVNHVILLTDSNLGRLNPKYLSNEFNCMSFFCPTFRHCSDFLKEATIKRHPTKKFIHTGTNDLENPNIAKNSYYDEIVDKIFRIKSRFPAAKIIISSLLPRREAEMNAWVSDVNDFIMGMCAIETDFTYMNNSAINKSILTDKMHINEKSVGILTSNIKYALFNYKNRRR